VNIQKKSKKFFLQAGQDDSIEPATWRLSAASWTCSSVQHTEPVDHVSPHNSTILDRSVSEGCLVSSTVARIYLFCHTIIGTWELFAEDINRSALPSVMVVIYITCPRIAHRPLSCTSVAVVGHNMHSARSIPSWNFHARRWTISTDRSIDRASDVTKESTKRNLVQIKICRKRFETSAVVHFNNHGRAKNKVSLFLKYSH
jgi:hypothetical protein